MTTKRQLHSKGALNKGGDEATEPRCAGQGCTKLRMHDGCVVQRPADERRDLGGSLADPPGKFCAVVDIGTNFPPFMKYSCTDCPEGTGNADSKKTVQLMRGGRERCTWSSVDARKPR